MRVLQIHNQYYSGLGGEDSVLRLEADMLSRHGHTVEQHIVSTATLRGAGIVQLASAAAGTVWSPSSSKAVEDAVKRVSPDIVHVHNTFPLLSPAIYWKIASLGVPIVQTLHNFRVACANGVLLRHDQICEKCIGRLPLPGLRYRCYKDSVIATLPVVGMQVLHRALGTYRHKVDAYIALSDFAKKKFVAAGLPEDRIHVKPNFAVAPQLRWESQVRSKQFVFAGSILRYKGLDLLLQAWRDLNSPDARLVIIGDGPCKAELQQQFPTGEHIKWLGWKQHDEVLEGISQSRFVVMPSRVYENFPMVLVEAMSVGTPAIVPGHGAFPDIVRNGEDGLVFTANSLDSLQNALSSALGCPDEQWFDWSRRCRRKYEDLYSEERNYDALMDVYERAIRNADMRARASHLE